MTKGRDEMQNNGKNPLVSIISPCFNGEYFVSRFLNSILQQSYDNIEVIIIDDGSTDNTANVINSYKDKFSERNFTLNYIYQEHAGQSAAINQGLKIFNGDYMTWFDSDDFMTPDSIEKRVNFLEENPQYDFCICQLAWVPEDDLTNITYVQKRIPPPLERLILYLKICYLRGIIFLVMFILLNERLF